MTKKVTTIPALLNKQSTNQVGAIKKRRVAAYLPSIVKDLIKWLNQH